jgi:hypothetical protein
MPDALKYLLDGVAGIALFMSLMLVFLVDLIISRPSGPGKNTLENVRAKEVEGRSHGKKLKLAITKTGEGLNPKTGQMEKYDDMGKLLSELGEGYRDYDHLSVDEIISGKKIFEYDVVFLTCNLGGEDKMQEILRQYVSEGGILYASDLRYAALAKAFRDEVAPGLVGYGHQQELDADIVDSALLDYLTADAEMRKHINGKKMHLKFDLGEWRPAAFDGPRTKVLMKGNYKKLTRSGQPDQGFAVAPLMVKFTFNKGTVIFTSFHNEKQNSAIEKKLLEYLVFSLITAGVEADVNARLDKSGFAPQRSNLLSTPQKNQSISKTYENKSTGDLRFVLGFRKEGGAKLRFHIKSPDGKEYSKDCEETTILEVDGARAGTWTYTVTNIHLPYENFPFTVTVGDKR